MPTLALGTDLAPIFGEIDVSPAGYPFADATYSMIIGERKDATVDIKPRTRADWLTRGQLDMMDAEVNLETYENDLQEFYNWLLMSRNGYSNWKFKGPDGKFWYFVENVGNNIGAPIGTCLLGTLPTFVCGDKERSIKVKASGGMYIPEWKLLTQSGSATYAGGTSGAAISGFVHTAYDQSRVAPPGILNVAVGSDSLNMFKESAMVTLDLAQKPYTSSPRHQSKPNFLSVKIELDTYNVDLANTQQALEALINTDTTFTIDLAPSPADTSAGRGNMKIILASSCFLEPNPVLTEPTEWGTKIVLNGGAPLDSPAWAGNNVAVLIDATHNSITINRIGVA